MMTAEQFELAWRRGTRRFYSVPCVEVSAAYVEGWDTRMRALSFERDRWLELVDEDLARRGNWLRQVRIDELDAERWLLAIVRDQIQTINARATAAARAAAAPV